MPELTYHTENVRPPMGVIAAASFSHPTKSSGTKSSDGNGSSDRGGTGKPRRHRLVVAVFDTLSAVGEAVGELVNAGYVRDQICLLCAGIHIEGIDAISKTGPTLDWLADREVRMFAPSGHVVIASSRVMAEIAALLSSSTEETGLAEALPPLVHRTELRQHLAGRAVVLIVDTGNLDRQQTCTRMLMRRTRHAVQTHQVATSRA
jgi:hypothetical protein